MKYFRQILGFLVVLFVMFVIYRFSNQDYRASMSLSGKVVEILREVFHLTFISRGTLQFLVRKAAHFILFFVLGIVVYIVLEKLRICSKREFYVAIFLCFLYACTDEFHQLFIRGRNAQIIDILLDTFGSFCGVYFFRYVKGIFQK